MLAEDMRHRPEKYEDTDDPHNPPVRTGIAGPVVVGLWYYLTPLAIVLLLMVFARFYWYSPGEDDAPVAVTTDTFERVRPGGHDPNPRFKTVTDELMFRGER